MQVQSQYGQYRSGYRIETVSLTLFLPFLTKAALCLSLARVCCGIGSFLGASRGEQGRESDGDWQWAMKQYFVPRYNPAFCAVSTIFGTLPGSNRLFACRGKWALLQSEL